MLLFSKKYGKISAGTSIAEKGRNRSSLALRPFTYGRYEMFKNRESYNINSADVIRSYYGIGEDVDKYMNGAYVLEFTERILSDEVPAPGIFSLLIDFFDMLENRSRGIGTLVLAYQTKVLRYSGVMPQLDHCAVCGEKKPAAKFSIRRRKAHNMQRLPRVSRKFRMPYKLIYDIKFGILDILKYFTVNPLKKLEHLALKEDAGRLLQEIIREYAAYYLDASDCKK